LRKRARGASEPAIGDELIGTKSELRGGEMSADWLIPTGAITFPSLGDVAVTGAALIGGTPACVTEESGSKRTWPAGWIALDASGGNGGPKETADGCDLCEASSSAGNTGWPKNFATPKPTTTKAVAKKIF
jgi:hypothetical protein